jgi:hypothetical protein
MFVQRYLCNEPPRQPALYVYSSTCICLALLNIEPTARAIRCHRTEMSRAFLKAFEKGKGAPTASHQALTLGRPHGTELRCFQPYGGAVPLYAP